MVSLLEHCMCQSQKSTKTCANGENLLAKESFVVQVYRKRTIVCRNFFGIGVMGIVPGTLSSAFKNGCSRTKKTCNAIP